jgi:hypothetical protein
VLVEVEQTLGSDSKAQKGLLMTVNRSDGTAPAVREEDKLCHKHFIDGQIVDNSSESRFRGQPWAGQQEERPPEYQILSTCEDLHK